MAGARTSIHTIFFVIPIQVEESLFGSGGSPNRQVPLWLEPIEVNRPYLHMTNAANKIIVALDVPSKSDALQLVEQLRPEISFFKIGLQLYIAEGPEIVRAVLSNDAKVFLDLKLYDIPNTVAHAIESASKLGVQMLTIHLSGGTEMIRAAVAAKKTGISILGVTVLTSATQQTLDQLAIGEQLDRHVIRLANLGAAAGIDGLVASPFEVKFLRTELGDKLKLISPGVRPAWSEQGDQKRTMMPREAIDAGADYLVIGRPITAHKNPREALEKILRELK